MVQEFHDVLNSVFPDIQFTMEAEASNQLPFLDVLTHRKPYGHLKTTVYRKATNTRQILSFHSKHPLCDKRRRVRTLYRRAETHCSEQDDRRSELRYLQRLFMSKGYPRNFIERGRQAGPSRRLMTERPKICRPLPYIDGASEAVSRLLRPMGIGISHRPESTIRHLVMWPKAPLTPGETTNVIYRTQCNSCEVNYNGETGKRLQTRVGEHMRAVRRMDPLSLVAEHCADSGHTFAFLQVEILGRGNDRIARETIEAWHTETTSINRCVALPAAYQALRAQLRRQMSRREPRPNMNPDMSESMADAHSVTPQPGSDEGAVVTTAVPSSSPADEKTDSRCGVNKIASHGRQLRSMKVRTTTTNASTAAPDVD
ncbi:hypothetical protein SprV_0100377800 [Sparganum proliferum]